MDRLSEMEAFTAVIDQGGFTGAAHKLGISKSAVSKHVSSLETRLGTRLLNRTTRRVNPTEVGLVYYDRARTVLTAASEADATVTALHTEPSGTLQIAVPTSFGTQMISPLIGGFLKLHPSVDVNMEFTDRDVDMVSENFDLSLRLGQMRDASMRSYRLDTLTLHLVASPDYLEAAGEPRRIEDLAQHRLLHVQDDEGDPSWSLVATSGEMRIVRTRGRLVSNNAHCVRDNALGGLGIAFLPDFLVDEDLAQGRLQSVLPALPTQTAPLLAVYPPDRAVLPRVRAFLDYIATAYSQPVKAQQAPQAYSA